ncbi:MAG: Gfo/Idh/MocA family oxidoreductase [Bryobacteraceae bacterium]
MTPLTRRAVLMAAPAAAATRFSPNERIRIAIIGLRGRGQSHIKAFHALAKENVEIAALCDCDQNVREERAAAYESLSGRTVRRVSDMRRLLDDKSIHAVSFATPNHWHALGAVWACQNGKDVYLEKPGAHVFAEGKRVMDAASSYRRIVQHGTQNRSSPNIVEAIEKLKQGVIGRVYMARGIAYKTRAASGPITRDSLPNGLNWDAWLGPAPYVEYSQAYHRRPAGMSWHLFWDFGNGEIGNQGVHELDIMRWGLGLTEPPSKVVSMGGKFVHPNDAVQAPQVQTVMYEFAGRDLTMTFETRSGFTNPEAGMGAEYPFLDKQNVVGVIFIGTEGYMIIPDYSSYHVFLGKKREKGPSKTGAGDIADLPHFENFVKAVRSGDPADLNAPPAELQASCALAHFANIAQRTGRMLRFDAASNRFDGDAEATAMLDKSYRAPYRMPAARALEAK